MKIGFYYHVAVSVHHGVLYIPALLGVFIDDLSSRVDQLTLLVHIEPYDARLHDYPLMNDRIHWVNLGSKHNFPHRLFLGKKTLANLPHEVFDFDLLLVRAPTPLAPALYNVFSKKCPVTFMIVGDYSMQPVKRFSASWFLNRVYERIVNHRVLPNCLTMVNSPVLRNKYERISRDVLQIRTTTLKKYDFFFRNDTCRGEVIHLLYVGRYDWQKGLQELLESVVELKKNTNVKLHMVGWDTDAQKLNQKRMEKTISDFGISEQVVIEGYKKVGEELNKMYEMADVFVLPSYAEGFPRCIWEAMAHGTPVVATTVGGIPEILQDAKNALLIPPYSTKALTAAVERLLADNVLRKNIIKNAYALVNDVTLEVQNEKIVNILQKELKNKKK